MSSKNRKATIITPLGDKELIFQQLLGGEEMGRLFEFTVDMMRNQSKGTVDVTSLLGKDMTVKIEMADGSIRYLNGAVTLFKHTGFTQGIYTYQAILRPWLWYLTRKSNCRIFQDKTIPDIVKEIIQEHSYVNVEYKLEQSYQALDYCVQYRESDFQYISRIMEHAGIFYYFKHDLGQHTLVITDNSNAYQTIANYTEIPYFPPGNKEIRERDHIYEWLNGHHIQSGAYETNDYDFEAPSADLTKRTTDPKNHLHDNLEMYEYPGKYTDIGVGKQQVDVRIEELSTQYSLINGHANALSIQPGMQFTLTDFYFEEENTQHVIVGANYTIQGDHYGSDNIPKDTIFNVNFLALNSKQQYRPARLTPKPTISGSQTAIVVGKQGEEIWTDKYGRVKVQFHWDREGEDNENSSCWIRVSYPTAGKKWGWVSIPRIDQEVIVSFLEGDPDQPLITGRVYNAEQMPPYTLPKNQTQSGIKTRSSKDGVADNFNELRFEDKKGEEEIYVHAEKDYNRVVENNDTLKVGFEKTDKGDQTVDIYNDRTVTLAQGNDALTLKMGDQTINIDAGKSTTEAMQSIELKVGANSIKIDQKGITLKGIIIKTQGTAMIDSKAPMIKIN